jgi:hypothetical protein
MKAIPQTLARLLCASLVLGAPFASAMEMDHSGHGGHKNHSSHAQHTDTHQGHAMHAGHKMDALAMVMNGNSSELPIDCVAITEEVAITVKAGTGHAMYRDGKLFGYSRHQWNVKPCARVTVTFINEDDVRHQWMLHGLPDYLHRNGMFHMELNGRGQTVGQFIVPSADQTLLVHCDISQHTEKGMKAQLVIGNGAGDLPNVPGVPFAKAVADESGAKSPETTG